MTQPQRQYTIDDYFAIEEMSTVRHEYYQGEIFAMSGGTRDHNQIAQNLARAFDAVRDRGCRAYVTDVRVQTPSGLITYPDVAVTCRPGPQEIITDPVLLAEVLSRSTAKYDRGQKFELYQSFETFRDYILADQFRVDVEHRWRNGDTWQSKHYTSRSDELTISALPIKIRIADIYDLVDVP